MSDMQAAKVRLKLLNHRDSFLCKDKIRKLGDDAYEIDSFLKSRKLMMINGSLYHAKIEELDPYGFVTSSTDFNGVIEITALWYNGGANLEEIISEGLNND